MPTYEYACKTCGRHTEVQQSFTDDALTTCETCGGPLRKVFGNIAISFKGSGFYSTDNRSMGKAGAAGGKGDGEAHGGGEGASASESSSDGKSESSGSESSKSESSKSESTKSESTKSESGSGGGGSKPAGDSGSGSKAGSKSGEKSAVTAS